MLLVRKVEGPKSVEAGDLATYRAREFNEVNPSEAAKSGINWMVECDGEELKRYPDQGVSLTR